MIIWSSDELDLVLWSRVGTVYFFMQLSTWSKYLEATSSQTLPDSVGYLRIIILRPLTRSLPMSCRWFISLNLADINQGVTSQSFARECLYHRNLRAIHLWLLFQRSKSPHFKLCKDNLGGCWERLPVPGDDKTECTAQILCSICPSLLTTGQSTMKGNMTEFMNQLVSDQ